MTDDIKTNKNAKIGLCLLIGILCFFMSLPFSGQNFGNGYAELRLTGLLPMAVGMLFGLPGALGCALGNLASDVYCGLSIYSVFGFFGNFLMAWMPYKLWHTLFFAKEHSPYYLCSAQSLIKFVCVLAISSCVSVGTIAAGGHLLQGFSFCSFFLPVALQYYDFSILGGTLIFQICYTILGIKPHVPKKVYEREYQKKRYIIDYILSGVIILLTVVLVYRTPSSAELGNTIDSLLCVLFLVTVGILAVLPMVRSKVVNERREERKENSRKSMKVEFVSEFLVLLCALLVIVAMGSYRMLIVDFELFAVPVDKLPLLWLRIFMGIAFTGTILIIVLGLFLKTIQNKVIDPVYAIAGYTKQFAAGEVLADTRLPISSNGNELDELSEAVNIMADDIRDFVEDIKRKTIEEERMAVELKVAKNIQQGLLPSDFTGTGFDLVPYIKPAKEVGGDFYHFAEIDENKIFICIADVSGKDISAAMFMVQAKILIEAACGFPPNKMLEQVNNTLSKANKAMLFVTIFAAVIDKKNKCMLYANAGHNAPICYNNGKSRYLDDEEPDFVLGAVKGMQYKLNAIDIADDFKLFIYTDGVNEAENTKNEFFGNERLFQKVDKLMTEGASCAAIIQQMELYLDDFTENAKQSDDITMMAVEVE